MIGKIINNKIILPPNNDGNKFNVNQDSDWLESNGFVELTETEISEANQANKLNRTIFERTEIREAFKALNIEDQLENVLALSPDFKNYWLESENIDLEHTITIQALSNFTADEINAIKAKVL